MTYSKRISELRDQHHYQETRLAEEQAQSAILTAREVQLREAQEAVQQLAQRIQQQAHQKIAGTVSRCLEAVFGAEAPSCEIQWEAKRGKAEARLLLRKGDLLLDPLESSGGGVVDVAAFALRMACLMLARPKPRRLLVLDEPFRFVSKEFRPQVRLLLERLAGEMGLQIVMVTHAEDLITGKVVEL